MIKSIHIHKYRKLSDITIDACQTINAICGTNGTCKTSILHLISNSVQAPTSTCCFLNDKKCIKILKRINNLANPKIETLVRGDKQYNDPAISYRGNLYSVEYVDGKKLNFRKHNSKKDMKSRYSIKPLYTAGANEKLPYCPVIYLGLSRLFPFGVFEDDESIIHTKEQLPEQYEQDIKKIYNDFTGLGVKSIKNQILEKIKTRVEFDTDLLGIDSNTISDGEDNLFIIIKALVSLKYYFESINSNSMIESILLIDELDATLHPSYQIKLIKLFEQFSKVYKIQIFFTTHSISLIEYCLKKKYNIKYFINNIKHVTDMKNVNISAIKLNLKNECASDVFKQTKIYIITEDPEARCFIKEIFDKARTYDNQSVQTSYYDFSNISIGAEEIRKLFEDHNIRKKFSDAICVLDGDKKIYQNLNNNIVVLPGYKSPEELCFYYSNELLNNEKYDDFWDNEELIQCGYSKEFFRTRIKSSIDNISDEKSEKIRVQNKKIFNTYKEFFLYVLRYWIYCHENEVDDFLKNLYKVSCRVAQIIGLDTAIWAQYTKT